MATVRSYQEAQRFERLAFAAERWRLRGPIVGAVFAAYLTISLLQSYPIVYLFVLTPVVLIALELSFELVDKLEQVVPRGKQGLREIATDAMMARLLKLESDKGAAQTGIDQDDVRHFQH